MSFSRWSLFACVALKNSRWAMCGALVLTAFPVASVASLCLERVDKYNNDDEQPYIRSLSEEICWESCFQGDEMYIELNDKILFSAVEGFHESAFLSDLCGLLYDLLDGFNYRGCELWVRHRRHQTFVKDINPGPGDGISHCPQPVAVGGVAYFLGDDGVHGQELWRSDGTSEGTRMVKDLNPGPDSGILGVCRSRAGGDPSWVALGNVLIFVGFTPEHGYELWRSDGTEQGTWLLRDIWPGPRDGIECGHEDPVVPGFVVFQDKVLFKGNDGVTGLEPWVTDGTPEGTRLLKDIVPGSHPDDDGSPIVLGAFADRRREPLSLAQRCEGFINNRPFTVRDGFAFFWANEVDPVTGRRFSRTWQTDGTPQRTYPADQTLATAGNPGRVGSDAAPPGPQDRAVAAVPDGGCSVAPGGAGGAIMFVGFILLLFSRRVQRRSQEPNLPCRSRLRRRRGNQRPSCVPPSGCKAPSELVRGIGRQ